MIINYIENGKIGPTAFSIFVVVDNILVACMCCMLICYIFCSCWCCIVEYYLCHICISYAYIQIYNVIQWDIYVLYMNCTKAMSICYNVYATMYISKSCMYLYEIPFLHSFFFFLWFYTMFKWNEEFWQGKLHKWMFL